MVRYLKLIVIIFGSIGLLVGSFFYYQNRVDIGLAWKYSDQIDYDYLASQCNEPPVYVYPCLYKVMQEYFGQTSLTGTSFGMKMAFNVMEEDKFKTNIFPNEQLKNVQYALNQIEFNNLALDSAYKHYYGLEGLYGGFLSSIRRFFEKGSYYTDGLVQGLEGEDGISKVKDEKLREELQNKLNKLKKRYYVVKKEMNDFLTVEIEKLSTQEGR